MDKYKQQMRNLRKQRGKSDRTPYFDEGEEIFVMDCLSLDERIPIKDLNPVTETRDRRMVIKTIECPACHKPMSWSRTWDAFSCRNDDCARTKVLGADGKEVLDENGSPKTKMVYKKYEIVKSSDAM